MGATAAVDGATNPGWIGGKQLRYPDVEDDHRIVLRAPPLALAGSEVVARMVWRRRGGAQRITLKLSVSLVPDLRVPLTLRTPNAAVAGILHLMGVLLRET